MPEPPRKRTDLDDWLGGDDDWADTGEQTAQIPRQGARPPVPGDELSDDEFDIREELYRRRRMIALGAIGLGIVILIIVLVVVFGGGDNAKNTTPSTPVVTT